MIKQNKKLNKMRIRQGNDFIFLWAIERNGEPEDLDNAKNIKLHFKNFDCIGEVKSFQIVDDNIVRVEVSPEWASNLGAYRLILSYEFEDSSYSDGDRKCVVDVLAFNIVPKTSEADDVSEMAKTTDIMIGLKGDKGDPFTYDDFTPEQIEDLKRPAIEAAESVLIVENQISINEQGRVQAENERETAETIRVSNENNRVAAEQARVNAESLRATAETSRQTAESLRVEAELLRQSNTQEAISNAENAAENANTAAQNADDARLAIQDDLALKADQADLAQLADEVSQIKVKDAVQDSKIKDIESIISTMNPNQSAQVSVSGVSPLSLPKNAANGGMSVKLEGLTEDVGGVITNFEPTGRVRSVGKNLLNAHIFNNGLIKDGYLDSEISDFNGSPAVLLKDLPSLSSATGNIYLKGMKQNTQYTLSFKVSFDKYTQPEFYLIIRFVYSDGTESSLNVRSNQNNKKRALISSIGKTVSGIQIGRQYASVGDRVRIYDMSLTEGAVEIPYEPYRETSLYLTAPELKSNGAVKDEIRKGVNGYELVKRVGVGTSNGEIVEGGDFSDPTKWELSGTAIISNGTLKLNADAGVAARATQSKTITAGKIYRYKIDVLSITGVAYLYLGNELAEVINIADSGKTVSGFFLSSTSETFIRLSKDLNLNVSVEFDNISIFEYNATEGVAIAGGEAVYGDNIHYTLATPVITPISYGGVLNSAENGTVYHEPIIADAGVYDTKIDILLTDYPIASIEEIIKHENGVDTYLNVASAVIASDGLSFTHPDLTDGDLVLFTYAFDKESTNGNITATFYDSNVVKIDTVTGKAYKIEDVVTNGVLTRTLIEV